MHEAEFNSLGITFKKLSEDYIELVRIWRNSDDVRPYMQYQGIITSEEQKLWFKNLDKSTNYYFIAFKDDIPFGVFNIKDIDFDKYYGEAGIFLKDRSFWESDLTIRATIILLKFAFDNLKLKYLISHVLKDNKKTLAYNKQLGFQIDESITNPNSYELKLTKERFEDNKKLTKLVQYLTTN